MPDWQLSYLQKERAYSSNAGTIYVDLPKAEQVSMLMVDFHCHVGTTVDQDRSILDVVKNVRVLLEGNKDAYNCQPEVGSYLAFLATHDMPPHILYNGLGGDQNMRLPIFFGRYPFDPDYMLDLAAYSSAQLEIEYELNTTYEGTGTAEVTVWLMRPVTRLSPQGFIRSRILNDYTSAASGAIRQVDLPTGLPWLNLGARIFDLDEYLINCVTDLDLNIDQGRMHIFQGRIEDLVMLNQLWYGAYIDGPLVRGFASSTDTPQTHMGIGKHLDITTFSGNPELFGYSSWKGHQVTLQLWAADGSAYTTDRPLTMRMVGQAPWGCLTVGNFAGEPFAAPQHNEGFLEYTYGSYATIMQTWIQEVVRGAL